MLIRAGTYIRINMVILSFTALVGKISDYKQFIPGHTHRVDHNVKVYDGIFYHSYDPLNPQVREKLDMWVRATFQNTHVWTHDLGYYYDSFNSIPVISTEKWVSTCRTQATENS